MMKKSIGYLALSVVLVTTSCKQESAADKITDATWPLLKRQKL